eukprot:Lithocolla_globosa_v1_NODE_39_length_8265_cov_28.628502.p3 type:complete len:124 gc:universal NODE_39_length_8265_cov_28.628502:4941-5312(+)
MRERVTSSVSADLFLLGRNSPQLVVWETCIKHCVTVHKARNVAATSESPLVQVSKTSMIEPIKVSKGLEPVREGGNRVDGELIQGKIWSGTRHCRTEVVQGWRQVCGWVIITGVKYPYPLPPL